MTRTDEQWERLIGAAPDMLAALQMVVASPHAALALQRIHTGKPCGIDQFGGEVYDSPTVLEAINAAIAKAGEQS